jgi:hypothetical protein
MRYRGVRGCNAYVGWAVEVGVCDRAPALHLIFSDFLKWNRYNTQPRSYLLHFFGSGELSGLSFASRLMMELWNDCVRTPVLRVGVRPAYQNSLTPELVFGGRKVLHTRRLC